MQAYEGKDWKEERGEREGDTRIPDFLNGQSRLTGSKIPRSQAKLNLIQNLETPVTVAGNAGGDTQLLVPATVLNNIMVGQQNLANIVTDLSLIVNAQKAAGFENTTRADKEVDGDAPVTQRELRQLLQRRRSPPNIVLDLEPPLANDVITAPYPCGYQPPVFRKFDGTGSAKEHIMSFLDDLDVYQSNKSFRLKEFSKSLSGRAFTRYAKLRPYSIKTWEDLVMKFCGKFLEEEGAVHIMDLGRVKQRTGEGLVAFIKRYRDRALQCKETLPEADLVYGCIKNVEDGSHIFLSLSGITTFAELMKKAADIADAMKRQGKRLKGKVLLPEEHQNEDLHRRPLPNHSINTIVSSAGGVRIKEVEEEPYSKEKILAVGLAKTRGFRVLFGQLGMGHDAQREAAEAIINIVRKWGGQLGAANAPLTRLARAHAMTIIFREPADMSPQFCHNRPLYVEATIEGIRVRRALVDNGSGVVESLGRVHVVLEIHLHQCVPSTLHQCVKSNFKGKEIEIPGVKAPFEASEAHLIDASLFDEMAPPGSSQLRTEQGTPLGSLVQQNNPCRPTQAFKRPRPRDAAGIQKEYLPNGEVRWRVL
ncbi:hypothetical protein SESBI_31574 [Sesbania bispinosa]|nr:hypothetical protein SESBI_31574 [Sesbania bispinosa]